MNFREPKYRILKVEQGKDKYYIVQKRYLLHWKTLRTIGILNQLTNKNQLLLITEVYTTCNKFNKEIKFSTEKLAELFIKQITTKKPDQVETEVSLYDKEGYKI